MKFSEILISKFFKRARLPDIQEGEDIEGQGFLPGIESREDELKAYKLLKQLKELEDKFWDTFESEIDSDRADDFEVPDPTDEEVEYELDSYYDNFESIGDEWFDSTSTDYQNDLWVEFLDRELGDENLQNDYPQVLEAMLQEYKDSDEKYSNWDMERFVEDANFDKFPVDINPFMESGSKSSPGGGVPRVQSANQFYKLIKSFDDWWKSAYEEQIRGYVRERYSDSAYESVSERKYEDIKNETPQAVRSILKHLSDGNEVELNEVEDVDDFFNDVNDSWVSDTYRISSDWKEHLSPIVKEMQIIYAQIKSLTPDIKKLIRKQMPKSNTHMTQNEARYRSQVTYSFGRPIGDSEWEKYKTDLRISDEVKSMSEDLGVNPVITYEQYVYYTEHPDELNTKITEEAKNRREKEAEQKRIQEEKERKQQEYRQTIEKNPTVPLKDSNQQLMINLVQKLKNKGNIGKDELNQFFSKFKKD